MLLIHTFLDTLWSRILPLLSLLAVAILISTPIRKFLKEAMLSELKGIGKFDRIPLKNLAAYLRVILFGTVAFLASIGMIFSQRPLLGLLGFVLGPVVFRVVVRCLNERRGRLFDQEILVLLATLSGLVRSGLSLAGALKLVSETDGLAVAPYIARYLQRFQSGQSLGEVLARFQKRSGLKHAGALLHVLAVAQSQGNGIAELLDQMVKSLDATLEMERRIRTLRHSVLAQGIFAALLPWGIFFFLLKVYPEVQISAWVCIPCLILQAIGGGVLWHVSRFR